jgi:hypothetical protein
MAGKRRPVLTAGILTAAGVRYDTGMKRLIYAAVSIASWLLPHPSFAQGTDIGISGVGLLAIQPVDDAYVGSPYLSEGIGGFAPGFGAGVSIIAPGGFVAAAELTTARFEQEQSGRLVRTGFPDDSVPHTTRLRDSLLSGLVGYAWLARTTRVVILGGLSAKLDEPTIDGEPREPFNVEGEEPLPVAPTGGVDLLTSLNSRTAVIAGARYSYIDRPENHRYLGIGPHVLRVAAGIRVRIN